MRQNRKAPPPTKRETVVRRNDRRVPTVSRTALEKHLRKWQDILRLRDWDIRLQIVTRKWRKFGDVKIDLDDHKAILLVNHRPYSETDVDLEGLVIHELLHIKLYALDQMLEDLLDAVYGEDENDPKRRFAYTQFMLRLETTVEDLTKGFQAATGSPTPISFGRLRRQVNAELGA
jgi:hypothetical protein